MQFIYEPKSGDRVFVHHVMPDSGMTVVRYGNGCRHVLGGVHLEYSAATPGRHWRQAAVKMATAVVQRFGGIAWDCQGTVNLIVPTVSALTASDLMAAAARAAGCPVSDADHMDIMARLVLTGHSLGADPAGVAGSRPYLNQDGLASRHAATYAVDDVPGTHVAYGDGPARYAEAVPAPPKLLVMLSFQDGTTAEWTIPADWSVREVLPHGVADATPSPVSANTVEG